MRSLALLAALAVACGSAGPSDLDNSGVGTTESPIIGGTLDATDSSVLEIFYISTYPLSACNGNASCLKGCFVPSTGQACSSGSSCVCGLGATCTGELIGPHTVVTAGHCTDLTAGGEVAGPGGPALTICSSTSDVMAVASGQPTSACNLDVFVLFDNKCTTNDIMSTCEQGLVTAGSYIVADKVINPGYDGSVQPPYTATSNNNDIGLVHLGSSRLENGQAEPGILTFNRAALGAACSDLGSLRFVGYGVTTASAGSSAISGVKYSVTHDVRVKDTWHNEEDGAQADPQATCGPGSGEEPTCSGDSGGPSFDSAGVIVGITSLGDTACMSYGQDTRIDAYADWIDGVMAGWGDPKNGSPATPDAGSADGACGSCRATTGTDSGGGSLADSSVRTGDGGNGAGGGSGDGAADASSGAADATGSSGGRSGGSGGCAVGAAGSGGTEQGLTMMSVTFAVCFLARRRRPVRSRCPLRQPLGHDRPGRPRGVAADQQVDVT